MDPSLTWFACSLLGGFRGECIPFRFCLVSLSVWDFVSENSLRSWDVCQRTGEVSRVSWVLGAWFRQVNTFSLGEFIWVEKSHPGLLIYYLFHPGQTCGASEPVPHFTDEEVEVGGVEQFAILKSMSSSEVCAVNQQSWSEKIGFKYCPLQGPGGRWRADLPSLLENPAFVLQNVSNSS